MIFSINIYITCYYQSLIEKNEVISHQLYSPGVALSDFYIFDYLKYEPDKHTDDTSLAKAIAKGAQFNT
jgi:hypothetical protein